MRTGPHRQAWVHHAISAGQAQVYFPTHRVTQLLPQHPQSHAHVSLLHLPGGQSRERFERWAETGLPLDVLTRFKNTHALTLFSLSRFCQRTAFPSEQRTS